MISPELLALVIRARTPVLSEHRAMHFASAIVATVSDAADLPAPMSGADGSAIEARELDGAAALIVIGERESRWRWGVERCAIPGIEGWGAFGVGALWEGEYPGGTCGSIQLQARAAWGVLAYGVPYWQSIGGATGVDWRVTFGHYIGAKAVGRHPEAKRRAREFWRVRGMLVCACSGA